MQKKAKEIFGRLLRGRFAIPLFLILLLALFAPLSLKTASLKAENFLSEKIYEAAKKLERRQGLAVKWEKLHVSLIPLIIRLKSPKLYPASMDLSANLLEALSPADQSRPAPSDPRRKKSGRTPAPQAFFSKILDGVQSAEAISVRPALLPLLFKRQLSISKVTVRGGNIAIKNPELVFSHFKKKRKAKAGSLKKLLKTAKEFFLKTPIIKSIPAAPLRALSLQNASLSLKSRGQTLRLSQTHARLQAEKDGNFRLSALIKKAELNEEEPAALKFSALISKNKILVKEAGLKNKLFHLAAEGLEAEFGLRGLKRLKLKSSGALPSSLLHQAGLFAGRSVPEFDAFLDYKLDMGFRRRSGVSGRFELKGKGFSRRGLRLRAFAAKGSLKRKKISIRRGFLETSGRSRINIDKMELDFQQNPGMFSLSARTKNLPLAFIAEELARQKGFPAKADLSGSAVCQGQISLKSLSCEADLQSRRVSVYSGGESLASLYDMSAALKGKWQNRRLNFEILGKKETSAFLKISGNFPLSSKKLALSLDGYASLPEDIQFHAPVPLKGELYVSGGFAEARGGAFKAGGRLKSPLFEAGGWRLENISSRFQYKKPQFQSGRLEFSGWKGSPGTSAYSGEAAIDFQKREFFLKGFFPFLDARDLQKAAAARLPLPFLVKGTGEMAFRARIPWESNRESGRDSSLSPGPAAAKKHPEFSLKGNLFSASIKEETFQRISFDISSANGKGLVKSLTAKKGNGMIEGSGSFDSRFHLDLDFKGDGLYLEQIETLNSALPLNQSGIASLRLKVTGPLSRPRAAGRLAVTDSFLYTYPVRDTKLKADIDGDRFSLSGDLMGAVSVSGISGSFSGKGPFAFQGSFKDWDIIRAFSAKSRSAAADYSSKLTGECSFFIRPGRALGKISVSRLEISKGSQKLKNKKPFSISLREGQWRFSPADFSHRGKKELKLRQTGDGRILIAGKSSLSLFSAFFPFLEGLEGDVQARIQAGGGGGPAAGAPSGASSNPFLNLASNPRGWIQITNGFFALPALPDFANIKALIKIDGNKIHIPRFESDAGGGSVEARGARLSYNFSDPVSVDIPLEFAHVSLNLPEGFHTKGSGRAHIKGEKPPYLIKGGYFIDSGTITKKFSRPAGGIKYNFPAYEEEERAGGPDLFRLDMQTRTKNPIFINNDLVRSAIEGGAHVQGPLKALRLSGGFQLSKKRERHFITFRGREFSINSGEAVFESSPP